MLVYAFRADAARHADYREWLETSLGSASPFGVSELVLSGVVRIVTHPRIFAEPTPVDAALEYVEAVRSHHNSVLIAPGARHFGLFRRLCAAVNATGNLVPDAYFAALAIESGSDWITDDRDFTRFPGLRVRHPLDT